MSSGLPEIVDPLRLIDLGRSLAGSIPISRLSRLAECLRDTAGVVDVVLEFGRDDLGRRCIRGRVSSRLVLQCQRCLEAMTLDIDSPVALQPVEGSEQAERVAKEYDPLMILPGERIKLAEMIEDELLLSLPQVPMHLPEDCRPELGPSGETAGIGDIQQRENPFAVFAELKAEKRSKTSGD